MDKSGEAYWKAVLTLIAQVLAVWFFVSFGCGILFADALNSMSIGGYPVGFWVAQQRSMYGFVILICVYGKLMNNPEIKFNVHDV